MIRKLILVSTLAAGFGAVTMSSPAEAGGWVYHSGYYHGGYHAWGYHYYGGYHGCCYGAGAAAGAVAGLAVGTAVGAAAVRAHPVYAAPPVVYAPRAYYYVT